MYVKPYYNILCHPYQSCGHDILKRNELRPCKLSQVVHGARAYNGQGQGHARPVLVTKMPFPQDFCPMNFNQTWRIVVNADRVTTVYICKRSKVKVT